MSFVSLQVGFKRFAATIVTVLLCAVAAWGAVFASTPYPRQWQHLSNDALLKMSKSFKQAHQLDSALACYSIVANRYSATSDAESKKRSTYAYCRMGSLYQFEYYNYQKSADCLLIALSIAQELADSTLLADVHHELGCLYVQYESSLENSDLKQTMWHYNQACRYVTHDSNMSDIYMFNYVSTGLRFGLDDKIITESKHYCDRQQKPNFVTHLCHAAWSIQDENYREAITWLDRSLAVVEGEQDAYHARLAAIVLIIKSAWLDKMGHDAESMAVLKKYDDLVREYNLKEGVPDYYDRLYRFYSSHGNRALAESYRLKYYESVDSLTGLTQLSYLTKASLVFDLQKAAEEARMKEIQHRHVMEILWLVIIAAVIFLAMMLLLYFRNRQLKERNQALYEQSVEQLAMIDEARKQAVPVQPLPVLETEESNEGEPLASNDIDEEVLLDIYQRVKSVMETSTDIYDELFSLARLHERVGSNTKYLSRAIGQFAHCDFKALLSQYRIREACRRMNDVEHYGNYTIEAIAKSVGVTSRTSFIQNFKKQTGLTPSAYFKLAREKNENNDATIA